MSDITFFTLNDHQMVYFSGGDERLSFSLSNKKYIIPSPGKYEFYLIGGDPRMKSPILKTLGRAEIKFSVPGDLSLEEKDIDFSENSKEAPIQCTALKGSSMAYFSPQHLIQHQFRKPEIRPNMFITLVV